MDIWMVYVEFASREDAVALQELLDEALDITSNISHRFTGVRNRPVNKTRLGKLILANLIPGRSYSCEEVGDLLVLHDYASTSASPMLSILERQGFLTRIGRGLYTLSQKAAQTS